MDKEPHKHKFTKFVTIKVPLYDMKLVNGKLNKLLVGYDLFLSKQCACGVTTALNVKRKLL